MGGAEVREHLALVVAVVELVEYRRRRLEMLDCGGILAAAREREADVVERQRLAPTVLERAVEVERRAMLLRGGLGVAGASQAAPFGIQAQRLLLLELDVHVGSGERAPLRRFDRAEEAVRGRRRLAQLVRALG